MSGILARIWRRLRLSKSVQLFIMRFVQDAFLVGVTGVILNDKDEILVFKHSYRKVQWSLPGGYMKKGEHPVEGLEREIEEESGLVVSVDKELKIRTDRTEARLDICFTGKFIGGEFKPSAEVLEYGFFSLANLPIIPRSQIALIDGILKRKTYLPPASTLPNPTFAERLKTTFTL